MTDIFSLFDKIRSDSAEVSGPVTHLVVGLGNPGAQYAETRHNAGFLCLDVLARQAGVEIRESKFHALIGKADLGGVKALLMKPQTFMNLSGDAVAEAAAFYKIPPKNIIVLCDDISFPVGHIRIRRKGSHGGHNGLRNIEARLGSQDYVRIKLGVGQKPHPEYDLADWVLSKMPKDDLARMTGEVAENTARAIRMILGGELDAAMNRYST